MSGGYTRRRPSGTEKSTALSGIVLLVPAILCIGYAQNATLLYLGLVQFGYGRFLVACHGSFWIITKAVLLLLIQI